MKEELQKILFVVNQNSGPKNNIDLKSLINQYFEKLPYTIDFFLMPCEDVVTKLQKTITEYKPHRVVAVGGDGTVTMVAKELIGTNILMGIIPAGSANGMARELEIPLDASAALDIIVAGEVKNADVILINNTHVCLHLSDVGMNARLIKKFDEKGVRGLIGYARVALQVLFSQQRMRVSVGFKNEQLQRNALMILIANASKYGTGATVNPLGNIYDGVFEVVIIRRLGLLHILKMFLKFQKFDPKQIEVLQATAVNIETKHPVHFQVDGEYLGKIKSVKAKILPAQLHLLVPPVT